MKRKWMLILALLMIVPALMMTTGCAKKAMKKDDMGTKTSDVDQSEADRQKALEEERLRQEAARKRAMEMAKSKFTNEHVYFAYDSSVLDEAAQALLKSKAKWLKENPTAKVLISGHCDERGTIEYNLALGDARAKSAKSFLTTLGVNGGMLKTVSYGEEQPLDPGSNEEAWAKNRRAQFDIQ
jgi:peptidoglycan-associated lipoprotein